MSQKKSKIEVRKATLSDLSELTDLFREALNETDKINKTNDEMIYMLYGFLTYGILFIAKENNKFVGLVGGEYHENCFVGRVAYVEKEHRNKLYKLISLLIREIKKTTKEVHIFATKDKVNLWSKIGFDTHRVWLRRTL